MSTVNMSNRKKKRDKYIAWAGWLSLGDYDCIILFQNKVFIFQFLYQGCLTTSNLFKFYFVFVSPFVMQFLHLFFQAISFSIKKVDVWFTKLLIYSFNNYYKPSAVLGIGYKKSVEIFCVQSLYVSG